MLLPSQQKDAAFLKIHGPRPSKRQHQGASIYQPFSLKKEKKKRAKERHAQCGTTSHPRSILTTHAPGGLSRPALARHQSQFPLVPAPSRPDVLLDRAGCCCESGRHVRFCYVISRHARGNMAAAGVVSGKVSSGPAAASGPVACGCWAAAEGESGPRRRQGRPVCDCDRTGRGVCCSARVLGEPRVRQFLVPGRAGLGAAVPLCLGAQRGGFSSDHPLGGQLYPCVPSVTPVLPTPAFCKSVRRHRGLADRELCSCVLRARGPARQ